LKWKCMQAGNRCTRICLVLNKRVWSSPHHP